MQTLSKTFFANCLKLHVITSACICFAEIFSLFIPFPACCFPIFFRVLLRVKWLCSSLQSLSSTVSSIESLGAPSTLKLPLWDKASAEFCFAKSRELLTKPSAWTSYIDIDLDAHLLDNHQTRQNLVKSTEFLKSENKKNHLNYENAASEVSEASKSKNPRHHQNGKIFNMENSIYDLPSEVKRVSTSYVERYFELPKYCDDEAILGCANEKVHFGEEKGLDKYELNNLEQPNSRYYMNSLEQNSSVGGRLNQATLHQSKLNNCEQQQGKNNNIAHLEASWPDENFDILKEKMANLESPRNKPNKFDGVKDKTNFDLGTRPKIPVTFTEPTKMNITEFKKIDFAKSKNAKKPFVPRNASQDAPTYGSSDNIKNPGAKPDSLDSPRGNIEGVKINIQSFRKIEQNQNGHEGFPFVISNNPLFIAESEKKESPIYSSSESLRVNFQRLRRKSDAEASQVELNSKLLAEKYQREVLGLENVKNYLDFKKVQSLNLGLGKLTQNMMQLGKNAQNSRNLESTASRSLISNMRNLDLSSHSSLRSLNIPIQKPKHLDLNIPLQSQSSMNAKLGPMQKANLPTSPTIHQHILEPPKLYQNDPVPRKELPKLDMLPEKLSSAVNAYRHRTSSLSENRKPVKNIRRSFHSRNDSSEDSDSVSHSEMDIRSRLRYKRRHKRGVPHNLRLNFKYKAPFLHPDSAKGLSTVELCGKSPPPSTSFLNSLSPPFSSKNNLLSWPESAPSSSLTFTSNSDFDSDTSSEYPEFTNDALTFPPSPAP